MPREGFGDILNHRGARARITEREMFISVLIPMFVTCWTVGIRVLRVPGHQAPLGMIPHIPHVLIL